MGLLDGRVALVTGAGGGIGREHALALAREGARVVVNDLGGSRDGTGGSKGMADETVEAIEKLGGEAAPNYDNVATVDGGKAMVETAIERFGKLDIVVNNAGILRDKTLAKMDEKQWDAVVAVHLRGTFCVTQPAFVHMKERGEGGVIINTSSTSGLNGNFGQCNYGAAKAGIAGFTRCLALEGQRYGIRAHILAPVATTRLTEDLAMFQNEDFAGKMGPEHIAPLVVFLASDLAKDLSNKTWFVGGGRIAEMKVVTAQGATKGGDGVWAPDEIAAHLSEILLPE